MTVIFLPEVLLNFAHPLTGLSAAFFDFWASVKPEKHLQTGNVLWQSCG